MKKIESLYTDGGNVKLCDHFGKQPSRSSKKLNIEISFDPVISLIGIYTREMKTYIHIKTFTQMLMAALFIIAKR